MSSLKSRHKAFLNQSILLWNRTFGSVEELEYPLALRPVLLRLRTLTELELPNFTVDEDAEVCLHHSSFTNSVRLMRYKQMSSPIIFLNSQPDEDIQEPEISTPLKPASHMAICGKVSPDRSKQPTSHLKRSPWSSANRRGAKTTPKARLRHDDSQIQFAAIDSSPLQPNEVESQMLTDRQKEVRQRQILEAATMFSNLGQFPQSINHSPDGKLPRLHLAENEIASSPILTGDEVTSSPAQHDLADIIGSSPTPRSRMDRFRCRPVVQPPSLSPVVHPPPLGPVVQAPSLSPVVQVGSSFDFPMPAGSDAATEGQAEIRGKEDDADVCDISMLDNDSFPSFSEYVGETLDSFGPLMDQPRTPTKLVSVKELIQETVHSSSLSDNDMVVGARPESLQSSDDIIHQQVSDIVPASVAPPPVLRSFNEAVTGGTRRDSATPMMHIETAEVSQDPDVFAQAPHTPNEDEQIAAKLVNDLERASSQAESERRGSPACTTASPRVNAKRKRSPEDPEPEWKKKKSRVQPSGNRQNVQIVVDSRQSGKAGAETVEIGSDGLSSASAQHAELKYVGLPAKTAQDGQGGRKRTGPVRHGPGRGARSSSASASAEGESGGTADASRQSAIQVKRKGGDHVPVGERRRSARLRGPPDRLPALPGSDGARTSSDEFGEFSGADVLEGISVRVEQARADRHSTAPRQSGDAGQESHEMGSSNGNTGTEAATGRQEIPASADGSDDAPEQGHEVRPQGILQSFRKLLENIKRVTLGVEEEREMVSVLVDSVREVHEAGRRHGQTAPSGKSGNEAR